METRPTAAVPGQGKHIFFLVWITQFYSRNLGLLFFAFS